MKRNGKTVLLPFKSFLNMKLITQYSKINILHFRSPEFNILAFELLKIIIFDKFFFNSMNKWYFIDNLIFKVYVFCNLISKKYDKGQSQINTNL